MGWDVWWVQALLFLGGMVAFFGAGFLGYLYDEDSFVAMIGSAFLSIGIYLVMLTIIRG